MATPRDLDPKFKSEKSDVLPPNENAPATGDERSVEQAEREEKHDEETPMIVHRQRITNPDGTVGEKVHGPMPVADWSAYEKEHDL